MGLVGLGYATVDTVFTHGGETLSTTPTARINLFVQLIDAVSRYITAETRRSFIPVRETRVFDARGDHITTTTLILDSDLLEVVTLTNGNSSVITSSDYVLRPNNAYPKQAIALKSDGSAAWTYSSDWEQAISIDGVWGYHESYDTAWQSTSNTVQNDPLSASGTSVTVTDADVAVGFRSAFQIGQWIKAESEVMRVVSVNATTNVLTVIRGQLGTTAASHAQGTAIRSYTAQPDIENVCVGLVLWLERNKGSLGEAIATVGGGTVELVQLPDYLKRTILAYRRARLVVL